VTVIGKTDRVGAAPANMALSRRRANAVRDALVAAGVPAASIVTSWTGEGKQQMATADEVDQQGNRVVDITVLKLPR
jgi:outer membrane protein OmpA-like peptidoglycan-associated protein